jgi:heme-NO-binding protein
VKGIMFDLLEGAVTRADGADAWDDALDATGLTGAYTSIGSYPDSEFVALVGAVADRSGKSPEATLRWFGQAAMPSLAAAFPEFFAGQNDIRTFVVGLNDVIHPEVRKIYPGANVPDFGFQATGDRVFVLRYGSPRRLCALAEGLIEGAAAHFGQHVMIVQPACMLRGDEVCAIEVRLDDRG